MPKIAYLTVDDAPSETFLDKLAFLEKHNIPAVWFAQGNYIERRPDMLLEAIRRGAVFGNHSYSHPHFSELNIDQCFAEIRATDAILNEFHERANVPRQHRFFRFPYGDKGGEKNREATQAYLEKLDYVQPSFKDVSYDWFTPYRQDIDWYWSYDSCDWSAFSETPIFGIDSPEKVLARIDEDVPEGGRGLNDSRSADVILVHDFAGESHELFKQIILRLLEKGIEFRSVV